MKRGIIIAIAATVIVVSGLISAGIIPQAALQPIISPVTNVFKEKAKAKEVAAPIPVVTVHRARPQDFSARVLLTGSLVAREDILVNPEIEGLRVLEVLVDVGDKVSRGQVLARLETATIEAQLAQNTAQIARANAAIAQARSSITQAEARVAEAQASFDRAKPLKKSGYLAESVFDQREAAAKSADAQLVATRDGLRLAEADKAQAEAARRDLAWRRTKTDITAPKGGMVSQRNARIGATASAANGVMFRIIENGRIELDAEATEDQLARLRAGQPAMIEVTGSQPVPGTVRLISPEIDRATRLGKVRIALEAADQLRIGAFARGVVRTAESRGLAVPASAILYGDGEPSLQVVDNGRVETRRVTLGLSEGAYVEVRSGLLDGELVVAKAGTFLRKGDRVEPKIVNETRLSTAE